MGPADMQLGIVIGRSCVVNIWLQGAARLAGAVDYSFPPCHMLGWSTTVLAHVLLSGL
jgi:hypothetical protein